MAAALVSRLSLTLLSLQGVLLPLIKPLAKCPAGHAHLEWPLFWDWVLSRTEDWSTTAFEV